MSLIEDWKKKITMAQAVLMHAGCRDTAKSLDDILVKLSCSGEDGQPVADIDAEKLRRTFRLGQESYDWAQALAERIDYMNAMSPLTREEFLEIKQGAQQGMDDMVRITQDENVRLRSVNNDLIAQVNALETKVAAHEEHKAKQSAIAMNHLVQGMEVVNRVYAEDSYTPEKSEKGSVV